MVGEQPMYLSLARLSSLVECLRARLEPAWVKHLPGALLLAKFLALLRKLDLADMLAKDEHSAHYERL